jgi:HEAT repeat protein
MQTNTIQRTGSPAIRFVTAVFVTSLFAATILFATLTAHTVHAFQAPGTSAEREQELLAVLRSDAAPADKALACKNLAIHGSDKAVPDLAKLLSNPQLSSWARIALEAIPGETSKAALRTAAESLEGRLLIGTINSIGFRRDAKAVTSLSAKLKDADSEVASAAAVALGNIGNAPATASLRGALAGAPADVRSAIAEGCVLCAERLYSEGNLVAATELYDEVRQADVPMQRIIEATRGAILARGPEGIPLLLETFKSDDKRLFQLALGTVREIPGGEIDKALAAQLGTATPDRDALIVQAMADRPDTVIVAAILEAALKGDKKVRLSAIDALRRVGNGSCLASLLQIAIGKDVEMAETARETLVQLPGKLVDEEIVTQLPNATGRSYTLLLQLVGQRRINAVPDVVKALEHKDQDVRNAALVALGETVSLKQLSLLISQVIAPSVPENGPVAQTALKAASVRMPDREACATELASALERATIPTKTTLLEILGEVGGTKALQTIARAANSAEAELQDTGSRLLGKWNGVDAAPHLLALAKTASAERYRVRGIRGYIGLARKFAMPEDERAEMCRKALDTAHRVEDQQLVLDVLKLHPSVPGLKLAIEAIKVPALKDRATPIALIIAEKVGGKGGNVEKLLAGIGLDKVKLEIVKAQYGASTKQVDVTALLRKQAGELALISLASPSYNAAFGGDPASGVVKTLKIQYRMNGKLGEASFAENALIILPMPK